MQAARILRYSRRRAGWSQRELARRAGTTQSAIARLESGASTPRFDTLAALVRACGVRLGLESPLGQGVDRSLIRAVRRLPPEERLRRAAMEAVRLAAFERSARQR